MAFGFDETNPVSSSYIADFPANERAHRLAVLSSVSVDHDAEDTGEHNKVSLKPLGADPSLSSTAGFIYAKEIADITELFYMDEGGQVIQLTDDGSASPDKVAIAGDTMTGLLTAGGGVTVEASNLTVNDGDILPTGTALVKLLNTLYLQGRDAADANWRDLIGVNASDEVEIGDASLSDLARIFVDDVDGLKVYYAGADKIVWNKGHYANAPIFTQAYESAEVTFKAGSSNTEGTVVHGIGSAPTAWSAVIRCVSTDLGYPSGAEIPINGGTMYQTPQEITVALLSATTFAWKAPPNEVRILKHDGTINVSALDDTKWRIVFYAWY